MLYKLVNKEYDVLVEVNCNVREMEGLIKQFKLHEELNQLPSRFVEWINARTKYVAELQDNPVLFDF